MLVVSEVSQFLRERQVERLVSQQLASADSVCSNIEAAVLLGEGEGAVDPRRHLEAADGEDGAVIQNAKLEIRNPKEIRMTETEDNSKR